MASNYIIKVGSVYVPGHTGIAVYCKTDELARLWNTVSLAGDNGTVRSPSVLLYCWVSRELGRHCSNLILSDIQVNRWSGGNIIIKYIMPEQICDWFKAHCRNSKSVEFREWVFLALEKTVPKLPIYLVFCRSEMLVLKLFTTWIYLVTKLIKWIEKYCFHKVKKCYREFFRFCLASLDLYFICFPLCKKFWPLVRVEQWSTLYAKYKRCL